MIFKFFVKHTSLFILGARFFVHLIDVLGGYVFSCNLLMSLVVHVFSRTLLMS